MLAVLILFHLKKVERAATQAASLLADINPSIRQRKNALRAGPDAVFGSNFLAIVCVVYSHIVSPIIDFVKCLTLPDDGVLQLKPNQAKPPRQ